MYIINITKIYFRQITSFFLSLVVCNGDKTQHCLKLDQNWTLFSKSKEWVSRLNQNLHQKRGKKKVRTKIKGSFLNKKLNNIIIYQCRQPPKLWVLNPKAHVSMNWIQTNTILLQSTQELNHGTNLVLEVEIWNNSWTHVL